MPLDVSSEPDSTPVGGMGTEGTDVGWLSKSSKLVCVCGRYSSVVVGLSASAGSEGEGVATLNLTSFSSNSGAKIDMLVKPTTMTRDMPIIMFVKLRPAECVHGERSGDFPGLRYLSPRSRVPVPGTGSKRCLSGDGSRSISSKSGVSSCVCPTLFAP